jgi:4-diphosphocytidyl-2-C-methyl-D-erythritol kinase
MRSITITAHAKINLSLRIGDKRADGFHDVRTILQSIELADRVICEPSRGPFEIVCSTPGVPADRTNLVWTAAQRLWEAVARKGELRGVRITLDKRIPTKAGLGGGSSDAAAALVALRRLWKLPVTDQALYAVAATIGSDVPYFLIGGTALGLGRGEDVYPLDDLPRLWVVLIFPPFGIATADAYRWLDDMREKDAILSTGLSSGSIPGTWVGRGVPLANDLEPPIVERHPVIAKLKDQLMKMGAAMAAMSGSGSTVFGVFTTERAAKGAATKLARSGADVRATRFLPRQKR